MLKKPCLALGPLLFLSQFMYYVYYYLPNTCGDHYILHSTKLILYKKGVQRGSSATKILLRVFFDTHLLL